MGNKREVEIAGRSLVVFDHDDILDPASSNSLAGSWVWDCSLVLAHWLETPSWPRGSFQNKRVVELGAGTGLPGMVAAVLGARVILTDQPILVPGLRRNVDENRLNKSVQVQALNWGEDCSALVPPFDYILMSDIVYDTASMPQLCKTLLDLSDGQTQILLAYELRMGTTACFQMMRERGLRWQKVDNAELHPVWQSEDIGIFRVWRET